MNTPANHTVSRRRLLGAGAALGTLGLAGCASSGMGGMGGPSLGRVVVVGGGFGGATAARYLRLWANVDVTLVERNTAFVSCPISNLVLGGHRGMNDISRGYDGLKAVGVKVVQGEVSAIDAAAKKVRLAGGSELPYDRLVLSPGVDFMLDGIPGLAAVQRRVLHSWKAGPQTLRRQLEAMPDGGVFAMAIPKVPYRCPPGPYERACMVASYLKQAKPRSKVLVLDANPEVQSKKALFEKAFKDHYAGILEYRANNELKEVQFAGSQAVAKLEFDDVKADVLNVIPPQRGGDIARGAGLLNMNARWAGVNWLTMESTVVPGIHVLGDATMSAPLMPKSGHMANQHAKVAAAAIIQLLQGQPVNPAPVVMNTCYSFVTAADVVHVASVHQYDNADKTFKTVPGSGGVSAAASALEGRYALSWADNIWHDMLNA
jgi:sulfide dehydrogenase [flavocytochrome c] flavoprotein chain